MSLISSLYFSMCCILGSPLCSIVCYIMCLSDSEMEDGSDEGCRVAVMMMESVGWQW